MITLTTVILVVLVALFLFAVKNSYNEGIEGLLVMTIIVMTVVLLCMVASSISEHVSFGPTVSKIEQLRKDVERVDSKNAEDVYGQATAMNQAIVEYKTKNKMFLFDQFIPDGWDSVKVIDIPENNE